MRNKTKILLLLAAAAFLLLAPAIAKAQTPNLLSGNEPMNETTLSERIKSKIKRGAYFLFGIESRINSSKEELSLLRTNIHSLEQKIDDSKNNAADLQSQLKNLDGLISINKEKVKAISMQIARYENSILLIKSSITTKESELKKQLSALDSALNAYYMQTNLFFDEGEAPTMLAFLSSDESSGDIIKQNEYLFSLQNSGKILAGQITENQNELDEQKDELRDKNEKLKELEKMLATEEKTLLETQQSKQKLLAETKGEQIIYETLLEMAKKEEEQVSQAIAQLKENYAFFETRLNELKNGSDSDMNYLYELSAEKLAWPVSPALGISAYYKDAAYEKALGLVHNAIDIRITQASQVKAAADGVVTKAADNNYSYSYIIIAHPNKTMTLYGHMSEIYVSEGQIVRQGQTIGLSGGIPGTKGAGWLTTGAHLHFEVFKNFRHADPLDYLALEYLPLANLPEKYLNRLTGEEKKIRRPE